MSTTIETIEAAQLIGERGRTDELRRLWALTWTLAVTDWKLRFYGSALGVLWTLVRPFAFFGVILFVFTEIAGLDKDVHHYAAYILLALVMFTFFGEVTGGCVQSLVARESLLRKMHFNPVVIPLSIAMTALLNLGTTFVAVLIFVFASGVVPDIGWLEIPVLVLALAMFSIGVGMLLSVLYVRYRDMQPIWEVVSQALFYASAVLYAATTVPEQYRKWILLNPLAAILTQMRQAIVDSGAPSLFYLIGWRSAVPIGLILGIFALGCWAFVREGPRVAENL